MDFVPSVFWIIFPLQTARCLTQILWIQADKMEAICCNKRLDFENLFSLKVSRTQVGCNAEKCYFSLEHACTLKSGTVIYALFGATIV